MIEQAEKTVYLIRHAESEANISPVYQSLESPLTELGIKQAKLIAGRISNISFETLISSPLTRAKETAEIIAKLTGKQPEYFELFAERRKPSRLVGKSHNDPEAKTLWQKREKSLCTYDLRAEDGENYEDIITRAQKALDFLKNRKEKEIVVVTHGFFLRTIIACVALKYSLTPVAFKNLAVRVKTENTGLSVLKYGNTSEGPDWLLWIFNDHAHLG